MKAPWVASLQRKGATVKCSATPAGDARLRDVKGRGHERAFWRFDCGDVDGMCCWCHPMQDTRPTHYNRNSIFWTIFLKIFKTFGIATLLCKYIFIGAFQSYFHTCTHHNHQYRAPVYGWVSRAQGCCWRRSPWGSAPPARPPPQVLQPPRRGKEWENGRPDPSLCSA